MAPAVVGRGYPRRQRRPAPPRSGRRTRASQDRGSARLTAWTGQLAHGFADADVEGAGLNQTRRFRRADPGRVDLTGRMARGDRKTVQGSAG
jgi:hypothetical protein